MGINPLYIVILSGSRKADIMDRFMKQRIAPLIKLWADLSTAMFKGGISSVFDSLSDIRKALYESAYTRERLIGDTNECALYSEDDVSLSGHMDVHQIKQKICRLLVVEELSGAESELMKLKFRMKESGQDLNQSKMQVLLVFSFIMGTVNHQYKGIDVGSLEADLYVNVSRMRSLYSLFQTAVKSLRIIGERIGKQRNLQNGIVNRVMDYLYKNYMSNIHLNKISKELGVSNAYLSRLYKKETGINLTDAINMMKIDKAKDLLRDKEGYKIYEVAEMVGISDAGYFCNVFKRYSNKTPAEFRNYKKKTK